MMIHVYTYGLVSHLIPGEHRAVCRWDTVLLVNYWLTTIGKSEDSGLIGLKRIP
jgi:hypothetical protein